MNSRKQRKPLPYSPKTFQSTRENGSPTRATVLLKQDHLEYVDSLVNQKQNFCTCLQLYKVSYQNQLPQKCLLHSNFITLYCENQYKLLCVNCIYGSAAHKDHRVVPSKNSIPNIARDNDQNIKLIQQELDRIKYAESELKNNKKKFENEYKNLLKQLDGEFIAIQKLLDQKYKLTKTKIIEAFDRASINNQVSTREVVWWKQTLAGTKVSLPKSSNHQQTQVYKHLVLDLFLADRIDVEKLIYIPSEAQMRNEFLAQVIELRQNIQAQIGHIQTKIQASNRGSRQIKLF